MKSLKKTGIAVLTMILAFALAVPAIASETYTVTIKDATPGHVYEAYQIFSGNLSVGQDGAKILSNVEWGAGVTEEGKSKLGEAAGKADSLKTVEQAEAFAQTVGKYLASPAGDTSSSKDAYVISGLAPGYYLIKDKDNTLTGDDTYTAFILEVAGNVEVAPKSAQPSVDKQVQNAADTEDGWSKAADYSINQSFKFKLTASLPADVDLAAYKTYKVVFTDTMDEGISFDSIESVKVGEADVANADYVYAAGEGNTWTLTIDDIMAYDTNLSDGAVVTVVYNAHLNEAAKIDEDENINSVNLKYSNNPNIEGEGSLGETPDSSALVFTYGVNNTKVDGSANNAPLAGAGFKLYSDVECENEIALAYSEARGAYYPATIGATGIEMTSAENGQFNVVGLDAGTYYLKETKTPAGYNTCDIVKVVVSAGPALNEAGQYVSNVGVYVNNGTEPVANIIVVNERGAALPSTGGMGTAMFYAAGSVLLIGAVASLIRRSRVSSK